MRTTIDMDSELLRSAKKAAADRRLTLTKIIEEALREYLRPRQPAAKRFRLKLLTRKAAIAPGVDLADRDATYHRMEEDHS